MMDCHPLAEAGLEFRTHPLAEVAPEFHSTRTLPTGRVHTDHIHTKVK
jgi:hypothetical protein